MSDLFLNEQWKWKHNSQRIKIRSMLNDIFTAGSSCRPTMADLWSLPNFSSIPPLRQIKEKSSRHVFPKIGDTFTYGTCSRNIQSWRKSSDLTGRITVGPINYWTLSVPMSVTKISLLWSSSWRLKFIHSQFPLPMALNSVFSFIKMSDWDLKFVYLFCQIDMFLFVIETPMRKCKHPFSRNQHLQNVEH